MSRLLIIDDDQSIRKLLRCIFEKLGHEVNEAENGEEGLNQYLIQPADVVITDLFLNGKVWKRYSSSAVCKIRPRSL